MELVNSTSHIVQVKWKPSERYQKEINKLVTNFLQVATVQRAGLLINTGLTALKLPTNLD